MATTSTFNARTVACAHTSLSGIRLHRNTHSPSTSEKVGREFELPLCIWPSAGRLYVHNNPRCFAYPNPKADISQACSGARRLLFLCSISLFDSFRPGLVKAQISMTTLYRSPRQK
ncbi:hypothetical protein FJTKL_11602 [Diaporthe vaccinii]|uniref:Uncharacterized protein n=1 Tax=Diaporthe vaccinii TaxID=105482 RepID=A0ABR4EG58_9PEZI